MRFEVKTDQNRFPNNFSLVFSLSIFIFLLYLLLDISLNLKKISKSFEINYLCKLILVDKSPNNFKKLSKLTSQLNKQKIWDLCREFDK